VALSLNPTTAKKKKKKKSLLTQYHYHHKNNGFLKGAKGVAQWYILPSKYEALGSGHSVQTPNTKFVKKIIIIN
jgi:hypothetical protein